MSLDTILHSGPLLAAFTTGRQSALREQWMRRAKNSTDREWRLLCIRAARDANHQVVRALRRLRGWREPQWPYVTEHVVRALPITNIGV